MLWCVLIRSVQRMRKYSEEHSPLRRNATGTDVGNLAAFLASDMASAITGQTIYGTCLHSNIPLGTT